MISKGASFFESSFANTGSFDLGKNVKQKAQIYDYYSFTYDTALDVNFSLGKSMLSILYVCVHACEVTSYRPPGSSVHEILQAKIVEWVAMPSSRGSSQLRDQTCISYVSCIGRLALHY